MTDSPAPPTLAERLADARAMLRSDVTVSRHLFQGEPSYMLHDPISFQNHRLSLQDYSIVAGLDDALTLQQCFEAMVDRGDLVPSEQEGYYRFVLKLQSLGVLSLPANNGPQLYERYKQTQKAKMKSLPMQLMSLRIPLARPDAFLDRTASWFGWLFSIWFVPVWLFGLAVATSIVVLRRDEFFQPLNATLTTSNVVTLAVVLAILKVWHELGHGYACKLFGGRVPEMGMILMMGAPLAYVDASAAWTFPRRIHRLIVLVGGMYFESLVAIPAVFVWAFWGPSTLLGSIAYQLVFMATAITVLFNANPLMKYDGYFILSDLLGVPNLRQRATNEINSTFQRHVLGLRNIAAGTAQPSMRIVLLAYGISASIYRCFVFLGLAALLASHAFLLGMFLGALFLVYSIGGSLKKFINYLWYSEQTASVRPRAYAISVLPLVVLPLGLMVLPTPGGIRATGVVGGQQEFVIHADSPGFVEHVDVRVGQPVAAGEPLVRLRNQNLELQFATDRALLERAELELQAVGQADLSQMAQMRHQVHSLKHSLLHAQQNMTNLVVRAPATGALVESMTPRDQGRFVQVGDPLATVVDGTTIVNVWLTGEQMRIISPEIGDRVNVRFPGARLGSFTAKIQHVAPAAQVEMDEIAATHLAGGDIPIDPVTGRSIEPLVQLKVELPETIQKLVRHKSQASLNFGRRYEPFAFWMARRLIVFIEKLSMS
ncbi:HlyD family secretion protein [Rosistilla carotiformis]|uniref:HlyD family secretion protein n=1 Tax=Rosistilla carotiformis TaxID=2528017 RepID=A0A518JXY8_9BACT|nr:HlyD family efflux transporter periplasmic adaptor subunit [Rosistilla carotiformis]QDV70403.1 HlyD family secretion protein [Rosistilla carotiformis]